MPSFQVERFDLERDERRGEGGDPAIVIGLPGMDERGKELDDARAQVLVEDALLLLERRGGAARAAAGQDSHHVEERGEVVLGLGRVLAPRLLLTPAVREARVVNETRPFHCVSCGKPFGTQKMVEAMMGRLAGHSMFTEGLALRRLKMCADCRVVDMMSAKDEVSVLKMGREG